MAIPLIGSLIFGAAQTAGLLAGAVGESASKIGAEASQKVRSVTPKGVAGGGMKAMMGVSKKGFQMQKSLFSAANPAKLGAAVVNGPKKMLGMLGKMAGKAGGMMGISFSVSSLLRQSQLFTGLMGALFQVLGGFIDVILAPFMPYVFKVVAMLAQQIPKVREFAQKLHDWLADNVFPIIAEWAGWIGNKIVAAWNFIKDTLWPPLEAVLGTIWEAISEIWGFIQTTIWPPIKGFIVDTWNKIKDGIGTVMGLFGGISVDMGSIKEKVVGVIKELLNWFVNNILPIVEKLRDAVISILITAVTAVRDIIFDTIWPALQRIFASFNENIVPVLKEAVGYVLELVSTLIDVIQPLIERIIIPLVKTIYKIIWFFLEKILTLIFKIIKFLWDYLIKWIVKAAIWLLQKLPAIINGFADFIKNFFKFDWLKKFLAGMLEGVLWMVTAIGKLPMVDTDEAQIELMKVISNLGGRQVGPYAMPVVVEITNNIDGLKQPSAQENYDMKSGNLVQISNGLNLGSEASSLESSFAMIGT